MRIIVFAIMIAVGTAASAQTVPNTEPLNAQLQQEVAATKPRFSIKAGYNVARLYGQTASFTPRSRNGFMVAGSYSPASKSGLGYRTELVFSRQGFGFDENGKTTEVTSDYVYMPHFTSFGFGNVVQLYVGGQLGYLLKSSKQTASGTAAQDITSFANRLDYGAAGGLEIYPHKNLLIGGRYNVSFGNAYKRITNGNTTPMPLPLPFNPDEVKGKNAVINFYIGLRL